LNWAAPDAFHECIINLNLWYSNIHDPTARNAKSINLNPVPWSSKKTRNPVPDHVVWNLANRNPEPKLMSGTHWEPKRFNYWLFDRKPSFTKGNDLTISASYSTKNGKTTITINEPTEFLGILVVEPYFSLATPITIISKMDPSWEKDVMVTATDAFRREVLAARGDKKMVFSAMIYFERDPGRIFYPKAAASLTDGGGENVIGDLFV